MEKTPFSFLIELMKEVNTDIELFYRSRKGLAASLALRELLYDGQKNLTRQRVLVIGSALPLKGTLPEQALRYDFNEIKSYERYVLPFSDCSFDYVIVLHALEHSGDDRTLLREIWRITEEGGKVLFIVPNRRGLWSGDETTPFGKGRPYSQSQLFSLLKDNFFTIAKVRKALLLPPFMYGSYIAKRERKLEKIFGFTAGVIAVEAEKTIYAPMLEPVSSRVFSKHLTTPKPLG